MTDAELVVDNFAGGGGASTGIEAALGRPVDLAINHSPEAIAMHRANHPETRHYCENIWAVDPREACGSRPVGLAWFSPDCTHFSKAKGGQPRSKEIRGLADVVIQWAKAVHPKTIILENVEEFVTWGPLDSEGYPIKARAGEEFDRWLRELCGCGYTVAFRDLVAANYGTPTTRKRLFLVAQRHGATPIVWPEPSHGKGRGRPWRTAAEIIDWTLPCPSIFGRKRPLADATLRRIAAGLKRYVLEHPSPFVVKYHGGTGRGPWRGQGIEEPLRTVDTENRFGLVTPYVAPLTHQGGDRAYSLGEPLRTVTAANRGELALIAPHLMVNTSGHRGRGLDEPVATLTTGDHHYVVAPTLVQTGYGEREGQAPRVPGLGKPLGTVVACGQKHALVAAFLAKHYGGVVGHGVERPVGTVTTRDHHSLVTAHLEMPESSEASFLTKFYGTSTGSGANEPLPTVTASGQHLAEVRAFLVKYYGSDGSPTSQQQGLFDPLHTVTTKARFGLVTVHGEEYVITDIGMRMLSPRELFNAQGFPENYIIDLECNGKRLTKTSVIELAGNSVCSQVAEALVRTNVAKQRAVA